MIPPTPVFLTEEESKKFILFMQFYDKINVMLDLGVFTFKNGKCIINADGNGNITSVEVCEVRRP